MKLGIISDVHANLEALTTALDWLDGEGVDHTLCLGDVVGYGADPNPCCELIRERCTVTLMGNHDAATVGCMDVGYYYDAAKRAIHWTREVLTEDNFRWLYSLPYTHVRDSCAFFHAAPVRPSGFYYVVQTKDAQAHTGIYEQLRRWNFIGHSHLTNQYALKQKKAQDVTGKELRAEKDRKYIINVGSVGQPRDRDPRLCFGVFDTEKEHFRHVRLEYDIEGAAEKIDKAGLDEKFARRLFTGQ